MKKDDLIALRDNELSAYYSELMEAGGSLRAEAAPVPAKTSQRLAIGGRRRSADDYDLVIRVQSFAGRAVTRANLIMDRIRRKYGENQGIDYAIVKRITAPSQRAVAGTGIDGAFGANKDRPISIGYSIGHREGGPGTIGLFAKAEDGIAAVSCNHVLARANEADVGDWIYQPGPPDRPSDTQNRIGKLEHYRELNRTGSNLIDAACCLLEDSIEMTGNIIPPQSGAPDAGQEFKRVIDPFDLDLDKAVAKIGRTTGYTREAPENISIGVNDVSIDFPGAGNHRFDNMIEVEWSIGDQPFAKPGDSGSVLYQEGSLAVFGLHVASGEIIREIGQEKKVSKVSYACPMTEVMSVYKLSLL